LDSTYLGLTIIAVGNALPDGVTTIALAKDGYAVMGMTGAYGIFCIKKSRPTVWIVNRIWTGFTEEDSARWSLSV
jgi:hypothetical protein